MLGGFCNYGEPDFSHIMYAGSMHQRVVRLPVIAGVLHNDFRARHIAFHKIGGGSNRRGSHLVRRGLVSRLCHNGTFQHHIFKLTDFQRFVEFKLHIVIIHRRHTVDYGKLSIILCRNGRLKAEYHILSRKGISLCVVDIIVKLYLIGLGVGLLPVLCQYAVCHTVLTGNHILIGGK